MSKKTFITLITLYLLLVVVPVSWSDDVPAGNKNSVPVTGVDDISDINTALPPKVTDGSETASEPMRDIIDIRPPEKIGFNKQLIRYILYGIVVLILLGFIIAALDYFLRRRKKKPVEHTVEIIPEDQAMRQLNELESSQIMEPREYYFRLTAILREYMGRRYGMDALEMTTEELIPKINEINLEMKLSGDLRALLKTTDPVKFAGLPAGQEKMENDFRFVKEFVTLTTPASDESETDKIK